MPDIALGVSSMTLSEHSKARNISHPFPSMSSFIPQYPTGPCPAGRYSLTELPSTRHVSKQKAKPPPNYPDLHDMSSQTETPTASNSSQAIYTGPDLFPQRRGLLNSSTLSHLPNVPVSVHGPARPANTLHLDVLGQRLDLDSAHASSRVPSVEEVLVPSRHLINDSDLALSHEPSGVCPEGLSSVSDDMGGTQEPSREAGNHRNSSEGTEASRDRKSPSQPEYQYKKSAL